MTSIFDDIKYFFSGPSIEKCSREEKKENDKHDVKVNEENERHKKALIKIKETASCKIAPPTSIISPLHDKTEDVIVKPEDVNMSFNELSNPPNPPEPPEPPNPPKPANPDLGVGGGRKRRTRRPRKSKGKNTKRSR
jgi:hypothetical protein